MSLLKVTGIVSRQTLKIASIWGPRRNGNSHSGARPLPTSTLSPKLTPAYPRAVIPIVVRYRVTVGSINRVVASEVDSNVGMIAEARKCCLVAACYSGVSLCSCYAPAIPQCVPAITHACKFAYTRVPSNSIGKYSTHRFWGGMTRHISAPAVIGATEVYRASVNLG
jgi:hypothetical protein